jgi:hypothetical protein
MLINLETCLLSIGKALHDHAVALALGPSCLGWAGPCSVLMGLLTRFPLVERRRQQALI